MTIVEAQRDHEDCPREDNACQWPDCGCHYLALAYHATTERRLIRYQASRAIWPPVRYWTHRRAAEAWGRATGASLLLVFPQPRVSYPMLEYPEAAWTPAPILAWQVLPLGQAPPPGRDGILRLPHDRRSLLEIVARIAPDLAHRAAA